MLMGHHEPIRATLLEYELIFSHSFYFGSKFSQVQVQIESGISLTLSNGHTLACALEIVKKSKISKQNQQPNEYNDSTLLQNSSTCCKNLMSPKLHLTKI